MSKNNYGVLMMLWLCCACNPNRPNTEGVLLEKLLTQHVQQHLRIQTQNSGVYRFNIEMTLNHKEKSMVQKIEPLSELTEDVKICIEKFQYKTRHVQLIVFVDLVTYDIRVKVLSFQ